jgi:hypothetical protein
MLLSILSSAVSEEEMEGGGGVGRCFVACCNKLVGTLGAAGMVWSKLSSVLTAICHTSIAWFWHLGVCQCGLAYQAQW